MPPDMSERDPSIWPRVDLTSDALKHLTSGEPSEVREILATDVQADGTLTTAFVRHADSDLERTLDAALPREISAETVYRVLRAKIERLERRISALEETPEGEKPKIDVGGSRS
jgi:hypothetical protein